MDKAKQTIFSGFQEPTKKVVKYNNISKCSSSKHINEFVLTTEKDLKEMFALVSSQMPSCVTIAKVTGWYGKHLMQRVFHTCGATATLSTYINIVRQFVFYINANVKYHEGLHILISHKMCAEETLRGVNADKVLPNIVIQATINSDAHGYLAEFSLDLTSHYISKELI